jgi:hypothetical protein
MIESGSQPAWMSVAEASRVLRISETAVRKRVRIGALPARGDRGSTEVLISIANLPARSSQPTRSELGSEARCEGERLVAELSEVRARLADAQLERDRWHSAAMEARADARAAEAARSAVERELRMLLSQS